jgi:NAD(P)-dependent dehydrogenase (short-subunit alcohol dehydrogenase family)
MTVKTILITGAASGIGAAVARQFHAAGWWVGLLDVNEAALADMAEQLRARVWWRVLDVTDSNQTRAVVEAFVREHGGYLNVLCNCAGILRTGAFEKISPGQHKSIIDINVTGVINASHAAFRFLRVTPDAVVVNMSSASAVYGTPDFASYSASKFAVRGLTEALNLEWKKHDIRVVDIMPPFVRTAMLAENPSAIMDRMGVDLDPADIASAIWQVVQQGGSTVHHPVSLSFQATVLLAKLAPARVTRALIGFLSR